MIAVAACPRDKARGVGSRAGLRQAIAREMLHRAKLRQEFLPDFGTAESVDHPGRHVVDRDIGRRGGAPLREFLEDQSGVETAQSRPAHIFLHVNTAEAHPRCLAQRLHRENFAFVPGARVRHHFVVGEGPGGRLEGKLFFRKLKIHGWPHPGPAACKWVPGGGNRPAALGIYAICCNFSAAYASNASGPRCREKTMANDEKKPAGPDLTQGVPAQDLPEGAMLTGHIGDEEVLLVHRAGRLYAISAHCTHYHGPLADGLIVGDTIRCPWHHAHFKLETGEAVAAPALSPLGCWHVEERGGKIVVAGKKPIAAPKATGAAGESIVIVGGGAAGFAAAEMLRRRGFAGKVTMISSDDAAPVDRP